MIIKPVLSYPSLLDIWRREIPEWCWDDVACDMVLGAVYQAGPSWVNHNVSSAGPEPDFDRTCSRDMEKGRGGVTRRVT